MKVFKIKRKSKSSSLSIIKRMAAYSLLTLSSTFALAQEYTFGVLPEQSATKLAKHWVPILKQLSEETGIKLRFVTAKNIPTFEQRLANGEYDFSYMNPYHFTLYNKAPGYQALAHRKDQPIQGIFVAKKDSSFDNLAQLQGNKLAFPAPADFAASALPKALLKNQGITHEEKFVSSHDSVYLTVAKGMFAAGGGILQSYQNAAPEVQDQLKILWTSPPYTPHAIAHHPVTVRAEDAAKIQQALVGLLKSEKGKQLLDNIEVKNDFKRAKNEDWNDVRALNLGISNWLGGCGG